MNTLVYSRYHPDQDLSWDSFSLRVGILLSDHTYAIGETPMHIQYKESMLKMPLLKRLKALQTNNLMQEHAETVETIAADLKFFRSLKNKSQREIVQLKRTEKLMNDMFEDLVQLNTQKLGKLGLHQLSSLVKNDKSGLILWFMDRILGEKEAKFSLSGLLSYKWCSNGFLLADTFTVTGALAKHMHETFPMTTLCTMPNLNSLNTEQLLSARERLAPYRKEIDGLIPMMTASEGETLYYTGVWNMEGLKTFSVRLQKALDATAELEWSRNLQPNSRTEVLVGSIAPPVIWQLMRDYKLIQDDTWEVLEGWIKSGDHCEQIPIMIVIPTEGDSPPRHYSEDESLQHRRKTINLD